MANEFAARIAACLQKEATSSRKPIAVFDCDGTVIKGDIGEAMFYFQIEHFLFRTSPANLWLDHPKREELDTLYRWLSGIPEEKRIHDRRFVSFADMLLEWYFDQLAEGDTEKACSDIVRLFARFSPVEVRQIADATFNEERQATLGERLLGQHRLPRGIRYIDETATLLSLCQAAGADVWAISGSNKWSVDPVFGPLRVPADHVIGIELLQVDNLYSSKIKTPVPVLGGKVEALRAIGLPQPSIVVSDSHYDAPLFRYAADLRILVNSRNNSTNDFFADTRIEKDDSWLVIDEPTLRE